MGEPWITFDQNIWNPKSTVVNEAYFGETPGIANIQRAISKFRHKWCRDRYLYDPKIHDDKSLVDLAEAIEKEFGFGTVSILLEPTVMMNAMTYPIGARIDTDIMAQVKKTPTGYRYNKEADYAAIFIFHAGMICNKEFTDREICAILLHEIGHNFSGAINKNIGLLQNINKFFTFFDCIMGGILFLDPMSIVLSTNTTYKAYDKFMKDFYKKHPGIREFVIAWTHLISIIFDYFKEFNFINQILNLPVLPAYYIQILMNAFISRIRQFIFPSSILRQIYGYSDEKFADQFATMYGYGPELHSGMDKMHASNYGLASQKFINDNIPLISCLNNMVIFPIELILSGLDPHPVAMERLASSIRVLEEESKHCNPKMRKRIKHDTAILKKQMDDYYAQHDKVKKQNIDPKVVNRMYYGFLFNLIGGDLRRQFFDRLFNTNKDMTTEADKK